MSVGFRPTDADDEIIQAHKRPGETTSDVLRRALRALDREKWQSQAREDMERIAASGENLSDDADDWGFDDEGRPIDLRGAGPSASRDHSHTSRIMHRYGVLTGDQFDQEAADAMQDIMQTLGQCSLGDRLGVLSVMSPTGSGKTEAALALVGKSPRHSVLIAPRLPVPALRALRTVEERHRATSWKLSHLRAAVRRVSER
jgi:hypothetical protein